MVKATTAKKPFVRSYYNYDKDITSRATGLICLEESRTQQHFKDEADINVLVRRFNITGQLPENVRMPTYADFSEVYDFHSAANAIAEANESFHQMPAEVRARFGNDPAAFVAFCSDDKNIDEARRMGLVKAEQPINTAPPAPVTSSAGAPADKTGSAGGAPGSPGGGASSGDKSP